MPRVPLPLIGPAYTDRSLPLSAQVTKGLYPKISPEGRHITSLHPFPGLLSFGVPTAAKFRGHDVMDGKLYVVAGSALRQFDADGVIVAGSKGTVTGNGKVDMANNGDQLMIATGSTLHMYTASTDTFVDVDDASITNPTTVDYLNNQFIFDNNDDASSKGEFVTTQVATDITATDIVDALDFAVADTHPDDIMRVMVHNGQVFFFGEKSIDPWWNSGVGSPPFDPIIGASRPYGLAGKWAIDKSREYIYFLDDQRIPRRMSGLAVENIGNPAIGQEWTDYVRVSDVTVLVFTLDHERFVQYNFPAPGKSWVYHEASNSWFELGYGTSQKRHRADAYAFVYGKHLVFDYATSEVYELDFDTFTDDGEVIQRKRSTAVIHGGLYDAPGAEIFFDKVEFIIETGTGLATGQGSDPKLMVRYSDDHGRTWSAEDWHDLGVGGSYLTRVELHRQGRAHQRIYELTYTDPTKYSMIEAFADISV